MIALCEQHHNQADSGAFTNDQLRALKRPCEEAIGGRFNWLRQNVVGVVGGNAYYETPELVQLWRRPLVWYERDEDGLLRFGLRVPGDSGTTRLQMNRNDWELVAAAADLECPPSGRLIHTKFPGGDYVRIEFLDLESATAAHRAHPMISEATWSQIRYPVLSLSVEMRVAHLELDLGRQATRIQGGWTVSGGLTKRCSVGLAIN